MLLSGCVVSKRVAETMRNKSITDRRLRRFERGNVATVGLERFVHEGLPQLNNWTNLQLLRYPARKPAHAPIGIPARTYSQNLYDINKAVLVQTEFGLRGPAQGVQVVALTTSFSISLWGLSEACMYTP